jgi:aminopeptidase-like protein
MERQPHYTYRFLFIPETIGAITWLARNRERVGHIRHGLVATCVGDPGPLTYKRSRRGDATIDRAAAHVLKTEGLNHRIVDFAPLGSDERQFCSPGFDLPVGSLMRTPYGQFPEYHTSADDLDFVTPESLAQSLAAYEAVLGVLEGNLTYVNTQPYGEPQLGRRGLYRSLGGAPQVEVVQQAMMWVLNLSDGAHDLLAIAERAGLPFSVVRRAADLLLDHDLLRAATSSEPTPAA